MSEVEILVSGKRYIRIWGAEGCLELNEAYCIKQFLPGALAIGDEVQYVAPSLSSLLIDGIGISKLMEL